MRIGLVSGEFPPLEGGVGAFTHELARALHALGHEIHVLTSRLARPASAPRRVGALREPLPAPYGWLHPVGRNWRWGDMNRVADLVLRYELQLVDIQYQAAAYNMRSAAINRLPWRLRGIVPTLVTFHDLRVPYLFPKAGPLRRRAVEQLARRATGAIATNPEDYAALLRLLPAARVAQIPIGSNIAPHPLDAARAAAARRQLGLADGDMLLGYFGFLNPSKGADALLEALETLPANTHVVFVGGRVGASDPETNRAFQTTVDAMIAQKSLNRRVHWTGFVADREVSNWLYACDLLVLPYRDGASLRRGTLMAALAHGRPTLSTEPAVATPELRHGENIWLVPRDNSRALAAAIAAIAEGRLPALDPTDIRAAAAQFSWERIAQLTLEFAASLGG